MTKRSDTLSALRRAKEALEAIRDEPAAETEASKRKRRKRGPKPVPKPKYPANRHVGRERTECTLFEHMELRGMSMRHLARCAGVDVAAVHKYCYNKALPNVLIAQRLAHVLRTSVGQLWPLRPIIGRTE